MSLLSPTLEAFWAVAEKGTVQEASKILGITQTGVTQRIRSLEKELKTTLFLRSRTGMRLTHDAEVLLQYVKLSKEYAGVTLSKLQNSTFESNIEITISGPTRFLQSRVIPKLPKHFSNKINVKFVFRCCSCAESLQLLKSGKSQIAIITGNDESKEYEFKNVKSQSLYLVIPKQLQSNVVYFESDIEQQHVQQIIKDCKIKNVSQTKLLECSDSSFALSILTKSFGMCLTTSEHILSQINSKNYVIRKMASKNIKIAWYGRTTKPSYFDDIINSIV